MRKGRQRAVRGLVVASAIAGLVTVPALTATDTTVADAAPASPVQQEPEGTGRAAIRSLVGIETSLATGDTSAVGEALDKLEADVEVQLEQLRAAEKAVADAVTQLAELDGALQQTQDHIDELTARSDQVTIDAFVSPPALDAFEVLTAKTMSEMSVRQAVIDMQNEAFAADLAELAELRDTVEEQKASQEKARADTQAARADAEAALVDLESAVSQQAQFVKALQNGIAAQALDLAALAQTDPARAQELQAVHDQLIPMLDQAQEAAAHEAALEAIAAEQARRAALGIWVCPVKGRVSFTDTWGAPRSGGRTHKGTDMMAASGTPTVAPVSGRVEHRGSSLGGLSWYVYGDDGNTYYGTHLSSYENVGAGHVERGTVIGYVGSSGNADASAPHLHFEFKPGGGASVNPYSRLVEAC